MDRAERREQIRQLVLDKTSQKKIAAQLKVHMTTVRADVAYLRQAGLLPPSQAPTSKSVTQPRTNSPNIGDPAHPHAERLTLAQHRAKAIDMRIAGHTIHSIAAELNRAPTTIQEWIDAEINELIIPKADQLRRIQVQRLEKWLLKLETRIDLGDDKAIRTALMIAERLSKLLGLDTPVRVDVTNHTLDQTDAELRELINESKARSAVQEQELREQHGAG